MAIDPVCCMTVDEQSAATTSAHAGTTFYFCSTDCGAKFEANPAAYLSQPEPVPAHKPGAHAGSGPLTQPPATTYTCPMHPEIVRDTPGDCPICGICLAGRQPIFALPKPLRCSATRSKNG